MAGYSLKRLFSFGNRAAKQVSQLPPKKSWRPLFEHLEDRLAPAVVDLTAAPPPIQIGALNGAIFGQNFSQPMGSGVIDSFVRIGDNQGVVEGYNTSTRPLQFQENNTLTFTHAIQLSSIPAVNIGGIMYREFLLDINQENVAPLLSLDELRIFVSPTNFNGTSPNPASFYDITTKQLNGLPAVYDLDAGTDNYVKLNYSLNSGSGTGDMFAFIPSHLFGTNGSDYVYLYSKFGVNYANNDGYEEWARGAQTLTPAAGQICGTKFHDRNGDGVRQTAGADSASGTADDEVGLSGWTMYLDANNNGVRDLNEVSTTTDANGNYCFTNLATGLGAFSTYRVREVQQSGWTQTSANPADIVLTTAGQLVNGINFGNFQNIIICGQKWHDLNGNGVKDAGDYGLSGWTVNMTGSKSGAALTNGGGNYCIGDLDNADGDNNTLTGSDLGPGTYNLQEALQAGWVQTYGNAGYTVVAGGTGVQSGATSTGNDFGNYADISISITPEVSINEVGQEHTFTVTVRTAAPITITAISATASPAPTSTSTTCTTGAISGPEYTCQFKINSSTVQTYTANASVTATLGGVTVTRDTDPSTTDVVSGRMPSSSGAGTGPATKYYVDANISIIHVGNPINLVGTAHTFSVTMNAYAPAALSASAMTITPSIVGNATPILNSTCGVLTPSSSTNGFVTYTATCTFQINAGVGSYTANAEGSITFSKNGTSKLVTRSTGSNPGTGGTGPAVKHYVDANISIDPPNAVNPLGQAHTFNVTVNILAPAGVSASYTITPTASTTIVSSTCGTGSGTGPFAPITCSFQINPATAGTYTANASVSINFTAGAASLSLTRDTNPSTPDTTNGLPSGSGPATKVYVDGRICGIKYQDSNGNGVKDGADANLSGWTIYLDSNNSNSLDAGERSTVTDANGNYCFFNLAPGTYQVREQMQSGWVAITGDPLPLTITFSGTIQAYVAVTGQANPLTPYHVESIPLDAVTLAPDLAIGNMPRAAGNARTLGFWSNKNGRAILQANDDPTGATGWRKVLNDLYLRDRDGNHFDVPTGVSFLTAYTQFFRTWLLNADAVNMAYMLSAQLATMALNVNFGSAFGFSGGGSLVHAPQLLAFVSRSANYGSTISAGGCITINNLMGWANEVLRGTPTGDPAATVLVLSGNADRSYFEALKTALDDANNNLNFVC